MTIDKVKQYFENCDYKCGPQTFSIEHTCKYGITWTGDWTGSFGELWRSWDLMRHCCCWVCHNHNCKEPRNKVLDNCGHICEIWTKIPYCKIHQLKKDIKEYKSILNNLYEDYDTWGDPYEEIPMYEQLLKEAEDKLKELKG